MTLLIGYGNTLRGDDAFGVRVAEMLQDMNLPDVEVLTCHQLTPELAEDISAAEHVLFIDASTDLPGGEVRWQEVFPSSLPRSFTHHVKPGQLLTLATQLYGRAAQAYLLTVGAVQTEHGEVLSPEVEEAVPQAVRTVRMWLANLPCC